MAGHRQLPGRSLAYETTGDTINDPDGELLDLTSAAAGYSDGKLYCRLTNHHNSWPTRGSIIGPWYLYSFGFRNPESPGDTWGYAMTHVSILTYSDGLYEVNAYTHDFTKIANIDIQMNGNRLIMRCDLSDLAARPRFQPWPNQCGYICTARGDARSADLSLNSWLHDSTNSSRFYPITPRLTVGQNTPPQLTNSRVLPETGPVGTEFWFSARYSDAGLQPAGHPRGRRGRGDAALTPAHHQYVNPDVFDRRQSDFAEGATSSGSPSATATASSPRRSTRSPSSTPPRRSPNRRSPARERSPPSPTRSRARR